MNASQRTDSESGQGDGADPRTRRQRGDSEKCGTREPAGRSQGRELGSQVNGVVTGSDQGHGDKAGGGRLVWATGRNDGVSVTDVT